VLLWGVVDFELDGIRTRDHPVAWSLPTSGGVSLQKKVSPSGTCQHFMLTKVSREAGHTPFPEGTGFSLGVKHLSFSKRKGLLKAGCSTKLSYQPLF